MERLATTAQKDSTQYKGQSQIWQAALNYYHSNQQRAMEFPHRVQVIINKTIEHQSPHTLTGMLHVQ